MASYTYVMTLSSFFPSSLFPRWNFAKFLVDHEGNPVKRYGPKTNPEEMVTDIEGLLAKRNSK
jgi:glutathione peroxidase-family protein